MSKVVDIGTLRPGDLCIMDNNKIGKVVVQVPCSLTKEEHLARPFVCRCQTKFENELGNIDWVWSNYKVTVD